jgi:hypothetical protein
VIVFAERGTRRRKHRVDASRDVNVVTYEPNVARLAETLPAGPDNIASRNIP